jgi:hypothetical protein
MVLFQGVLENKAGMKVGFIHGETHQGSSGLWMKKKKVSHHLGWFTDGAGSLAGRSSSAKS